LPGEALPALLAAVGFQGVKLAGYTGLKSSPYTEGALFYGEKPAAGVTAEVSPARREPAPTGVCAPGPS